MEKNQDRSTMDKNTGKLNKLRSDIELIIFGADTFYGKLFDIVLILCIIASVIAVMLDSIAEYSLQYGGILSAAEWFFTILFTIEYVLRFISAKRPLKYVFSFFGMIDLLAIIPTYLGLFFPGSRYLIVIRSLRVLRVFRVLKLAKYIGESNYLVKAIAASRRKITVFIFAVVLIATIIGSFMYIIEGQENGFTSIPRSIYWAIVTLTTVGYGDISPQTNIGQALAALVMIMGYGIIAIPTGIVTVELSQAFSKQKKRLESCQQCKHDEHDPDARFCKKCGGHLK